MGELFREFVSLFRGDESPFLKLARFIGVLALVFVTVLALESAMGLVTIGRLERKVNLITELNALTESGLGSQKQLTLLFDDVVSDLAQFNPDLWFAIYSILPEDNQVELVEVLSGASSWILIGVFMVRTGEGDILSRLKNASFVLAILLGLAVGVVTSLFIETPHTIWTIVLNFVFGLAPLVLLAVWSHKKDSRSQAETENPDTSDKQ